MWPWMNFPVLFRTIDGASQATIENAIRHGSTSVLGLVWQVSPSTFLFLQKGYKPLVCAHALLALWAALREGAGRPATDYRPVWVAD
jgi:hypothetical protein